MFGVDHLQSGTERCVSAQQTHETRCNVAFRQGQIAVVDHSWQNATSDVWHSEDYFLNLVPAGRSGPAHATYLDGQAAISGSVGRLMMVPPGSTIRSGACQGTQRTILCSLRSEAVNDLLPKPPTWSRTNLSAALHLNSPEVEWFLMKLYEEVMRPGFAQEVMIDSLANSLAVALVRAFNLQGDGYRQNSGGLAPWRMRIIRDRIEAEGPLPQLAELAELCGMSVRHLTRAFRAETKMTVARYVENAMVERARTLLMNTAQPIGEIAKALGFSSGCSFTYAFRRATGTLPSEMRLNS